MEWCFTSHWPPPKWVIPFFYFLSIITLNCINRINPLVFSSVVSLSQKFKTCSIYIIWHYFDNTQATSRIKPSVFSSTNGQLCEKHSVSRVHHDPTGYNREDGGQEKLSTKNERNRTWQNCQHCHSYSSLCWCYTIMNIISFHSL